MMTSFIRIAALSATAALATPALAGSVPAAGSTVSAPTTVQVDLAAPATGGEIRLTMTAMPGMARHAPMTVKGFQTVIGADGRSLVATLPRPLPPGTYSADWSAGGATGTFSFTVR